MSLVTVLRRRAAAGMGTGLHNTKLPPHVARLLPSLASDRQLCHGTKNHSLQGISRGVAGVGRLDRPGLVIFDKDGTLICFRSMAWWIEGFVRRLVQETGASASGLYSILHYDVGRGSVSNASVIARSTNQQVRSLVARHLLDAGVRPSDTEAMDDLVESVFHEVVLAQSPDQATVTKPLGDVKALFKHLKSKDVKVAVCTSDCRASTLSALHHLDATTLVDLVVCGDDETSVPKPDRTNALAICESLGVDAASTCIVGDTTADVLMGRAAGLGSVLGVLSGVGTRDDLEPHADDILDDIHGITDYFKFN